MSGERGMSRWDALLFCAISGCSLGLSHDTWAGPWVAWVGMAPIIYAVSRSRPGISFTWIAGLGGLPWALLTTEWVARSGSQPLWLQWPATTATASLPWILFGLLGPWMSRGPLWASVWAPAAWLLSEWLFVKFASLLFGSRSGILAGTQIDVPYVASLAAVVGEQGISFLLVSVAGTLVDRRWISGIVPLALLGLAAFRSGPASDQVVPLRVGLWPHSIVSPADIPSNMLDRQGQVDLWVLPELACRVCIPTVESRRWIQPDAGSVPDAYLQMARRCGCPVLLGTCIDIGNARMTNGATLSDPSTASVRLIEKHQLVNFYERWNVREVWDYLLWGTVGRTYFQPGNGPKCMEWSVSDMPVSIGVVICSEVSDGSLVRHARAEALSRMVLLAVIGNESAIERTHGRNFLLQQARWRAIENGCPVIRCSSEGINAVINEAGAVLAQRYEPVNQGIPNATIDLVWLSPSRGTFFSRYGEILVYLSAVVGLWTFAKGTPAENPPSGRTR